MVNGSRLGVMGLAISIVACGVPQKRVDALEATVNQMKATQSGGGGADAVAAVDARIGELEASTAEQLQKMQEVVDLVQDELAKAAKDQEEAPADGGGDDVWNSVDAILGVAEGAVADGNAVTVSRGWLRQQVEAMAASGKFPKFSEKKGAVQIKSVKPKTLPAALGLKNNDTIADVGGTAIDSIATLASALRGLSGDSVEVKILRKKKEEVLTYTLTD